jgi:hypothetical protein
MKLQKIIVKEDSLIAHKKISDFGSLHAGMWIHS